MEYSNGNEHLTVTCDKWLMMSGMGAFQNSIQNQNASTISLLWMLLLTGRETSAYEYYRRIWI